MAMENCEDDRNEFPFILSIVSAQREPRRVPGTIARSLSLFLSRPRHDPFTLANFPTHLGIFPPVTVPEIFPFTSIPFPSPNPRHIALVPLTRPVRFNPISGELSHRRRVREN